MDGQKMLKLNWMFSAWIKFIWKPSLSAWKHSNDVLNVSCLHMWITLESLRKSCTSCMRLFSIAQNYRVFPGFAAWFREFITLSGLCDTVLHSFKLLSGRCASWGSSLSSHHSGSTQISHTFRVLHRAVAAVMQFFRTPGLACQPNYLSTDLISQ